MDKRRKELGEFLQALRARRAPEAFGFPAGSRRRAPGLRREEVAQLAGISPTWYTWIEQGREANASADALERLAQALRLTRGERAYLFELAGRHDPQGAVPEDDAASASLEALLAEIAIPAYILGRTWDVLGWNKAAATLFAGWLPPLARPSSARPPSKEAREPPPNLLRYVFLDARAQALITDWETRARRLVAEFRADCRTRLDEPALVQLVDSLAQGSAAFARFWKQHDVLGRQGGQREFNHPRLGKLSYQQVTLHPVDQEHLKLVLLRPERGRPPPPKNAEEMNGDALPA